MNQIKNPNSHNPNTGMPAFSSLSDQQLTQLVDYLLSLGSGDNFSISTAVATPQAQAAMNTTPVVTPSASTESTAVPTTQAENGGTNTGSTTTNQGGPPGLAADVMGSAQHGSVLFSNECVGCHGNQGMGGVPNPGSNDGDVPSLNPIDNEFVDQNPQIFAENIDRIIQHGSIPSGSNPKLVMPAFGESNTLTQQEISDIEAYVLQVNHVNRTQLVNPGIPPKQFLLITLAVFTVTGLALSLGWWFRHSG